MARKLGFLEAVPNKQVSEYDLGRYLGLHRRKPEAFTPVTERTPYSESVPAELRMYRILLDGEDDILRGDKSWIAQSGARPLPRSADTLNQLRSVMSRVR